VVIDKSNYLALGFYALINFMACIASFMLPIETGGRVWFSFSFLSLPFFFLLFFLYLFSFFFSLLSSPSLSFFFLLGFKTTSILWPALPLSCYPSKMVEGYAFLSLSFSIIFLIFFLFYFLFFLSFFSLFFSFFTFLSFSSSFFSPPSPLLTCI
jgi:hypothetical protein